MVRKKYDNEGQFHTITDILEFLHIAGNVFVNTRNTITESIYWVEHNILFAETDTTNI
jgi:hypothetical protein